jgi:hypothetical protein
MVTDGTAIEIRIASDSCYTWSCGWRPYAFLVGETQREEVIFVTKDTQNDTFEG